MNENLQELIGKGKELTDIAYQKSSEMIERGKINVKISETRLQLKRAYAALGKCVYEAIKNGTVVPDKQMKIFESDIDSAAYRIKLLMRELSEIKGTQICPKCGTMNSDKAKYCNECAAPLVNHEEE